MEKSLIRNNTDQVSDQSNRILRLRSELIDWMAEYLRVSGKAGYVLGMSGGIDSTVLALLARDAAARLDKKLLALILPIDNDYYDQESATAICNRYGIDSLVVDLKGVCEQWTSQLPAARDPVAYTNLKARLRSGTLYYYANDMDLLVLGTVNKPEFTIGYFPKNASAGDLMPQADLLKREIRAIGEGYGLPQYLVNAKASGCIWAETAEEEWGMSEDELDDLVDALSHGEKAVMACDEISYEKRCRFLDMYRESAHKRKYYPMYKKSHGL